MPILGRVRRQSCEYVEFIAIHEPTCDINHQESAGLMVTDGLVECFEA